MSDSQFDTGYTRWEGSVYARWERKAGWKMLSATGCRRFHSKEVYDRRCQNNIHHSLFSSFFPLDAIGIEKKLAFVSLFGENHRLWRVLGTHSLVV